MRYIKPEMEIVELEMTDVITTSMGGGLIEGGDGESETGRLPMPNEKNMFD